MNMSLAEKSLYAFLFQRIFIIKHFWHLLTVGTLGLVDVQDLMKLFVKLHFF